MGETNVGTNVALLEIVQHLRTEMQNLCADSERLRLKQENIMKSLSNRQNQRNPDPSQGEENRTETRRQQEQHQGSEEGQTGNEEESDNVSSKKGLKR